MSSEDSGYGLKREYWAFISYKHDDNREEGREWATWLHHALETYEVPDDLIGEKNGHGEEIPSRISPVFRDEVELGVGPLSERIATALDRSRALVVLCSPRVLKPSEDGRNYVEEEILYFKSRPRKARNIYAAIIDGVPGSRTVGGGKCFPDALRFDLDDEGKISTKEAQPLAADFRLFDGTQGWVSLKAYRQAIAAMGKPRKEIKEKTQLYQERLENEKLRLISGILEVDFGVLQDRDRANQLKRAKRRAVVLRRWWVTVGLLTIAAVIGGFGFFSQKEEAKRLQNEKEANLASLYSTKAATQLENDNWGGALAYLAQIPKRQLHHTIGETFLLNLILQNNWPRMLDRIPLLNEDGEPFTSIAGEFPAFLDSPGGFQVTDPSRENDLYGAVTLSEDLKLEWSGSFSETRSVDPRFLGVKSTPRPNETASSIEALPFDEAVTFLVERDTGCLLPNDFFDDEIISNYSPQWLRWQSSIPEFDEDSSRSLWKLVGPQFQISIPFSYATRQSHRPVAGWFVPGGQLLKVIDAEMCDTWNQGKTYSFSASLFDYTPRAAGISLFFQCSQPTSSRQIQEPKSFLTILGAAATAEQTIRKKSPCGRFTASYECRSNGTSLRLEELVTGKKFDLELSRSSYLAATFSPSGNYLAAIGNVRAEIDDPALVLFESATGRQLFQPFPGVVSCSFDASEQFLLTTGANYRTAAGVNIEVIDLKTGGELASIPIFSAEQVSLNEYVGLFLAFSGDNNSLTILEEVNDEGKRLIIGSWPFPIVSDKDERLPTWFARFAEALACQRVDSSSEMPEFFAPTRSDWARLAVEAESMTGKWGNLARWLIRDSPFQGPTLVHSLASPHGNESNVLHLDPAVHRTLFPEDPEELVQIAMNAGGEFGLSCCLKAWSLSEDLRWPSEILTEFRIPEEFANSKPFWDTWRQQRIQGLLSMIADPKFESKTVLGSQYLQALLEAETGKTSVASGSLTDLAVSARLSSISSAKSPLQGQFSMLRQEILDGGEGSRPKNRQTKERFEIICRWLPEIALEEVGYRVLNPEAVITITDDFLVAREFERGAEILGEWHGPFGDFSNRIRANHFETAYVLAVAGKKKKARELFEYYIDAFTEGKIAYPGHLVYAGWTLFHLGEFKESFDKFAGTLAVLSGADRNSLNLIDPYPVAELMLSEGTGASPFLLIESLAGMSAAAWRSGNFDDAVSWYRLLIRAGDELLANYEDYCEPEDWSKGETLEALRWPEEETRTLEEVRKRVMSDFPESSPRSAFPSTDGIVIRPVAPHF